MKSNVAEFLDDYRHDLVVGSWGTKNKKIPSSKDIPIINPKECGYSILVENMIQNKSSVHKTAYEVLHESRLIYYAVVTKHVWFVRIREAVILSNSPSILNIIAPVDFGNIMLGNDWHILLLFPLVPTTSLRGFLLNTFGNKGGDIFMHAIVKTARNIAEALLKLHTADILHGSLNHNTVSIAKDNAVMLDECVSEPYAYNQIAIYTTAHTMQTHKSGRMNKSFIDDIYALGVLIYHMYTGDTFADIADKTEEELLSLILSDDIFSFLSNRHELPPIIANLVYNFTLGHMGKIQDMQAAIQMLDTVKNIFHNRAKKAQSIKFMEYTINSKEALAYYLWKHWDVAKEFIKQEDIVKWLSSSSKQNAELVEAINDMNSTIRHNKSNSRIVPKDDERLIKTIILLDQYGPFRTKDAAFYIHDIGSVFTAAIISDEHNIAKTIADVIFSELFAFYDIVKSMNEHDTNEYYAANLKKISENFRRSGILFGTYRLMYDLNAALPCISIKASPWSMMPNNIILFIENSSFTEQLLESKEIIAFLASKLQITDFTKYNDIRRYGSIVSKKDILTLMLFAIIQTKFNLNNLPKIFNIFRNKVLQIIDEQIHSITYKEEIKKAIFAVQKDGLHELLSAVFEHGHIQNDLYGYASAIKKVGNVNSLIAKVANDEANYVTTYNKGLQYALNFSYVVCGTFIIAYVIKYFNILLLDS